MPVSVFAGNWAAWANSSAALTSKARAFASTILSNRRASSLLSHARRRSARTCGTGCGLSLSGIWSGWVGLCCSGGYSACRRLSLYCPKRYGRFWRRDRLSVHLENNLLQLLEFLLDGGNGLGDRCSHVLLDLRDGILLDLRGQLLQL